MENNDLKLLQSFNVELKAFELTEDIISALRLFGDVKFKVASQSQFTKLSVFSKDFRLINGLLVKDSPSGTEVYASADCYKLPENCSKFFANCQFITSVDFSNFDTSTVSDVSGLFERCTSLESVDLSSFNFSNVKTMNRIFIIVKV